MESFITLTPVDFLVVTVHLGPHLLHDGSPEASVFSEFSKFWIGIGARTTEENVIIDGHWSLLSSDPEVGRINMTVVLGFGVPHTRES
jgi:hypothetical protein